MQSVCSHVLASKHSSHMSYRMAQLLLTHEADVNSQDEFSRADRVASVKRMRTSEGELHVLMHL